jgi:DNA-binding CsgD family transcriptional regulator
LADVGRRARLAAEARVATLIASGLSGPQTAATLGVSLATVKTHLARCFEKIGVHSQAGLVRLLASMPGDVKGPLWPGAD